MRSIFRTTDPRNISNCEWLHRNQEEKREEQWKQGPRLLVRRASSKLKVKRNALRRILTLRQPKQSLFSSWSKPSLSQFHRDSQIIPPQSIEEIRISTSRKSKSANGEIPGHVPRARIHMARGTTQLLVIGHDRICSNRAGNIRLFSLGAKYPSTWRALVSLSLPPLSLK